MPSTAVVFVEAVVVSVIDGRPEAHVAGVGDRVHIHVRRPGDRQVAARGQLGAAGDRQRAGARTRRGRACLPGVDRETSPPPPFWPEATSFTSVLVVTDRLVPALSLAPPPIVRLVVSLSLAVASEEPTSMIPPPDPEDEPS